MALLLKPLLLFFLLLSASATLAFSHPRPLLVPSEPFSDDIDIADRDALRLPSDDKWGTASDPASSSGPSSYHSLSSSSDCEAPYGFLPCTDTILGNLFLLLAYGYLLLTAAQLLSQGSELLLTVLDAGIIGGLLLPILGALPDSILILVSGIGGSKEEAQEEVLVGIGLLAGSIVMLLTALWGSCLLLGRCDLEPVDDRLTAVDKTLTRPSDIWTTGVENDELTTLSARIMILSIIPYLVAQLSMMINSSGNIPVLVACILSIGGLVAYCLYQIFTPWVQQRRKEIAQKRFIKAALMDRLVRHDDRASLIDERGNLNKEFAETLFNRIDVDKDGAVVKKEVALMLRTTLARENIDDAMVDHFMEDYDVDQDDHITLTEFLNGTEKWCKDLKLHSHSTIAEQKRKAENYWNELTELEREEEEEGLENPPTKTQIIRKAVLLLIVGTVMAAVFADPLVDAVNDFSSATSIPSFFISFVLLPFASNSSEAVSSILFSARKKKRNMSLTYSQIYGGVTMNNTMGLGIFLAVVYFRGLTWDFSSEVVIVCLVVIVMGLLASFRRVFPTWMASIALLLYPLSLGLVAILDYVLGWE